MYDPDVIHYKRFSKNFHLGDAFGKYASLVGTRPDRHSPNAPMHSCHSNTCSDFSVDLNVCNSIFFSKKQIQTDKNLTSTKIVYVSTTRRNTAITILPSIKISNSTKFVCDSM